MPKGKGYKDTDKKAEEQKDKPKKKFVKDTPKARKKAIKEYMGKKYPFIFF